MIKKQENIKLLSDKQLLDRYILSGDLDILGTLYTQYIHLIYGVCLKYLKNRETAKDAVSKIFELLITEIPKFEIQNFRTWLYVVAKNYCLMQIRKEKTEKKNYEKYSSNVFMESTHISHPIDEASDILLEKHLKKCIEELKKEQQECIVLFYFDKKCYKEISDDLNIEQKKVKSYIQNGKRNLKICIEQNQKNV